MARPTTKEVKLKSGYYIELIPRGSQKGIKIRRDSFEQIQLTLRQYKGTYDVRYIGEVKNGKVI